MKKLYLFFFFPIFFYGFLKTLYDYYKDFFFRRCIVTLASNTNLSELDYYLLANSYLKLKDYSNAGIYYSKITNISLTNDLISKFFVYFYADYIRKLSSVTSFSAFNSQHFFNILKTQKNSLFYDELERVYLSLLWKERQFESITKLTSKNEVYPILAHILLTNYNVFEKYTLEKIHFSYLVDYFELIDRNVFEKFTKRNFEDFIFHLINRNKYIDAKNLLDIYILKYEDYDFYNRNIGYIIYKTGNKKEAFDYLEKYVRNGKRVSWKTFQTLLDLLLKDGYNERAYKLIRKYRDFYAPASYDYWIRISKRASKYEELFAWYKRISKRKVLLSTQKREIFRTLLRNNLTLAKKMVSLILTRDGMEHYYLYVSALIDYEKRNEFFAYRKFLKIVLDYPFTYEWIISLKYEKEMRKKYYDWFMVKFREKIKKLKEKDSFSEKDALFVISLKYIDFPLSKKIKAEFIKKSRIFIAQSNRKFKEKFELNNSDFKVFFELESKLPYFMVLERLLLIEKFIGSKKYLFFYNNYDFLTNRGIFDFSVSTLNYYFLRFLGEKERFFLLERTDLFKVFPTNYIGSIERILPEPLLALSLIREESHFKKDTVSFAGAIGVAQVMPYTFDVLKGRLRLEANIYDFEDNLYLGLIHLKELLDKYKNSTYAIAAYNSGEGNVNNWIKKYRVNEDLWVECIDFNETYFYIRKIKFSLFMYQYLLSEDFLSHSIKYDG